jgi:hypothetical protein
MKEAYVNPVLYLRGSAATPQVRPGAAMSNKEEKKIKTQLDEQAEKSAASRESTTESQAVLNEVQAKLDSIQGALDDIKTKQGSQRETQAKHRTRDEKALKDFQTTKDQKSIDS